MAKRILFITTVNLSTNPRILKEIRLALSMNYAVSFLGFHLGNWSDDRDIEIQKKVPPLEYHYMDASRKRWFRWLKHSLTERLNRIIWKLDENNLFLAATASTKRSISLLEFGKKVNRGDFDLVIGHTLGTLYPASIIAKRAACPYAFDMEDYHPGEHIDGNKEDEIRRRKQIMKRLLPGAAYVSASSPIIGQLTKELCGIEEQRIFPILNFFYATEFLSPVVQNNQKIKLIWFSQFIGPGRGLDIILSEWEKLKEHFELTLIGISENGFEGIFRNDIKILPHLPQPELHILLSKYDIGLALEISNRDLNKDSAISNKMLAYYQAGLFILATDTAAQKDFIEQHADSGRLFSQNDAASFLRAMGNIRENIELIRSGSLKRFQDAAKHSWEIESIKLKETWDQVLN
jgi:Glycosyl transferases group 1